MGSYVGLADQGLLLLSPHGITYSPKKIMQKKTVNNSIWYLETGLKDLTPITLRTISKMSTLIHPKVVKKVAAEPVEFRSLALRSLVYTAWV